MIAFGEEVYNRTNDKGLAFYKMQSSRFGEAFLAFKIADDIEVVEIGFKDAPLPSKPHLYEGLIYTIRNLAASLGKKLILMDIDNDLQQFLSDRNDKLTNQKIEEIYKWKLIA